MTGGVAGVSRVGFPRASAHAPSHFHSLFLCAGSTKRNTHSFPQQIRPVPSLPAVCSFESRRQNEMTAFISKFGGSPCIAPTMRELPLESNHEALAFGQQLVDGNIDLMIFMTGVGTDALFDALLTRFTEEQLLTSLSDCTIVARGPKPVAALSKKKIRVDLRAPEPNTWHELASELKQSDLKLNGMHVAVQEYGQVNSDLHDWLRSQGANVTSVMIYRWGLPEDLEPLQQAIQRTIDGEFDILMWTSAQQLVHTVQVAEQLGVRDAWLVAARNCFNASIGPTASERLREFGIEPAMEPSHPKMAHLVREAIEAWSQKAG